MSNDAKTKVKKGIILTFFMILLIAPLAVLWSSYAEWQPGSSEIDNLIYIGKSQIFQKSTNGVQSAYKTFQTANAQYTSASRIQKIKIRTYLALTRLMDFSVRKDGAGTETLATFLAKYGYTYTGTTTDDLDLIQPINSNNKITLPASVPASEAIRSFLIGPFLATLNASISDMDTVIALLETTESKDIIAKTMIDAEDDSQMDVEVDDGDYYLYRSSLKGAKAAALTISAYNINVDVRELAGLINSGMFNLKDLLDKYPYLLNLLTTGGNPAYDGAGKLNEARLTLLSAINDYMIASNKIRNDSDTTAGTEELFSIVTEADLFEEQKFRNRLTQFQYSLTDASHPAAVIELDDLSQLVINLNPLFGNGSGPVIPRLMLPQFTTFGWGNPIAGTMGHGLGDDATLGGILPEYTHAKWAGEFEFLWPTGMLTLPTTSIVVDGNTGDWTGISPVLVDYVNDTPGTDPGMDISQVFLAKDATNYYFRMDTTGNRGSPDLTYDYALQFKQMSADGQDLPGDVRVWARYNPETVWTLTTAGGTVLEVHLTGKEPWSLDSWSYNHGSYIVTHAGTENPAFPFSGTSGWGYVSNGSLSLSFNSPSNLSINGTISGDQLINGTFSYYNPDWSSSSGTFSSDSRVVNTIWETYLSRYDAEDSYSNEVSLGANMSMGLGATVEWKVPLATLGDISGYFITAETDNPWSDWYSDISDGEINYTTEQIGPLPAMGKVNGSLTVPGYDGNGIIYIGVYPASEGYDTSKAIDFIAIEPDDYSAGMPYIFDNLPAGANVFVAVHWDRDGNGIISVGDYTSFSEGFTTSSAGTTAETPVPTVYTPYPAPVFVFADVSRIITNPGSDCSDYWLQAIVSGPGAEDVLVTVISPEGSSFELLPTIFMKQQNGQLYTLKRWDCYYGDSWEDFPPGEYTFKAVDSLGRRATPVKINFTQYDGVPIVDTATIRVNGVAGDAGSGAFYAGANPTTTPINLGWTSPGSGYVYDVEIYDVDQNVLFFTTCPNSTTTASVNIPAGTLQPETPYIFYVKTSDPQKPGNSTVTSFCTLYTGTQPAPAFSFANIIEQPPYGSRTRYLRTAMFRIPGVLPSEISSFKVIDSDSNVLSQFDGAPKVSYWFDAQGYYYYSALAPENLPDGNEYKFEATISRGGTQTVITSNTFAFYYDTVPPVDYETLSYGNNYYFDTTTPTFTWTGIPGTYYRLQIFDVTGNIVVYTSEWDYGPKTLYAATVQAGILLRGASYYWTVQSSYTDGMFDAYNYALFGNESDYKNINLFTILPGADVNASVSGLITNGSGEIQSGAFVEALLNDNVVSSTLTGVDGTYWLNLPKNTSYVIRVTVPGYRPKTLNISLVNSNLSGQNIAFTAGDLDASAPTISNPLPGDGVTIAINYPEISAVVSNSGISGIDPSSITLYVDSDVVPHIYNPATGKVSFTPTIPLSNDVHTVVLNIKNYAGQSAWASWLFVVDVDEAIPEPFTFVDRTDVALNTVMTSNTITVSGISVATLIYIKGGEYSINGGAYTSDSGTINNGDTVSVRQTSSAEHATTTNTTLTIGGVSDTFSVTTKNSFAYPVPDTGQTKCYNNTEEIPCPSPGEAFYGQDAQYSTNPRSYTKLDASGNVLPDSAASWTTVRDNVTGLIWEMKADDGTLYDKDKTFTWCDTNPATNGGYQGTCGTGTGDAATDTGAFINALNSAHYGGYSDWRLPTVEELSTLVNSNIPSYPGPSIDTAWFPNTVNNAYWSSTTYDGYKNNAWSVYFGNGSIHYYNKSNFHYVRAVRGSQSSGTLMDNGDGTVTDTFTGLMWQKTTAPGTYTWEGALAYCQNLNLAGYSDWRLPDRNELQSLFDYSRNHPAIDPLLASDTVSSYYWSSTTYADYNNGAWYVYFGSGGIGYGGKSDGDYVRAVRAGQSWSFSFTDQTGVALNTEVTSNIITVFVMTLETPILITGGTYSKNGGEYTSASGTVNNGDTITVQLTSSGSYSTTTNATLTIGGVSDTFSVTTMNDPTKGMITVIPLPESLNAPWTLTGPNAFSHSFNGDAVEGNLDPGEYTLTWGDVAGWDTPSPSTQTLAAGDSITFTGTYQLTPVVPTPPTSGVQGSNITLNGASFGATRGGGYVDFNGVRGKIISWSNNQIVVTVPYGATTGCMTVVTDYGTTGCMDFTVGNPACYPPVKVSNYDYFNVVQDAYANATDGNAIQMQSVIFGGNVLFNRDISTVLQGGYNCPYDTNTGYTTIDGSLTIKDGTVTVDKLIIK